MTEEINRNLVAIKQIVDSLNQSARETRHTCSELTNSGRQLNQLVERFQI